MEADYPWSHRREDWENPDQTIDQHTNSGPFPWATADRIVLHYTGVVDVPDGDPDELPWDQHVAAFLRSIQNNYVTVRGYSIGYGCLVTQDGDDWEIRGVRNQNAANRGWNERTFTILVFVDGADPLTPAAIDKVRRLVAWFRRESRFGDDVLIKGHRDIGATICPGAGVYQQITSGVLEPEPPKEDAMTRYFTTRAGAAPIWMSNDDHSDPQAACVAFHVTLGQWQAVGEPIDRLERNIAAADAARYAYVPTLQHDIVALG